MPSYPSSREEGLFVCCRDCNLTNAMVTPAASNGARSALCLTFDQCHKASAFPGPVLHPSAVFSPTLRSHHCPVLYLYSGDLREAACARLMQSFALQMQGGFASLKSQQNEGLHGASTDIPLLASSGEGEGTGATKRPCPRPWTSACAQGVLVHNTAFNSHEFNEQ